MVVPAPIENVCTIRKVWKLDNEVMRNLVLEHCRLTGIDDTQCTSINFDVDTKGNIVTTVEYVKVINEP